MPIIKLCYEELEKYDLRVVKFNGFKDGRLAMYVGVKDCKTGTISTKHKTVKFYCKERNCDWCGESVLVCTANRELKKVTCSDECKKAMSKLRAEKRALRKKTESKEFTELRRIRLLKEKKMREEKSNRYWELIEKGREYALYKRYLWLSPYYEIRRCPDDRDMLETKCAFCNKWFVPKVTQLKDIRSFINGKVTKRNGHTGKKGPRTVIYCSPSHGNLMRTVLAQKKKDWKSRRKPKETVITEYFNYIINLNNIKIKEVAKERKKLNTKLERERKRLERKIKQKEKKIASKKRKAEQFVNKLTPAEFKLRVKLKAKENIEKSRKKDPKDFKLRRLLAYSKVRAKEKNIPHTIDKQWLIDATENNSCYLTKLKFDYNTNISRNPFGPSIDRIDCKKGYTPDNCRIVLWTVNAGLGHYTEEDLYYVCKEYFKEKKRKKRKKGGNT